MKRNTPLLTMMVLILALPALAEQAKKVKLPESRGGWRVAAYFQAFNSGDEMELAKFWAENATREALGQRPVAERVRFTKMLINDLKRLEPKQVLLADKGQIIVLVQAQTGAWLEFSFQFEPGPAQRIVSLGVGQSEAPPEGGWATPQTEADFLGILDAYLAEETQKGEFSGVVLLARKGQVLYRKAYGLASLEYRVANMVDTKFNLGSINKLFTKVAIGQLAEQGKLSISDTIGKYIPDYPNRQAAEQVTIRQLLEMSSGIGDFFGAKFQDLPKDKLRNIADYLPLFAAEPLAFAPGSKQLYSNGAYVVLGIIIEKIAGQSYYDYVRERIFTPAGMPNTESFQADMPTANLASGYTREWDGREHAKEPRRNNLYTRPARGSSAGGGYSTVDDLLAFTIAITDNWLLQPGYSRWVLGGAEPGPNDLKGGPALGRGGLSVGGGAPGINASLEMDFGRGYTWIVLSNFDPPTAMKVGRRMRQWLASVKPPK